MFREALGSLLGFTLLMVSGCAHHEETPLTPEQIMSSPDAKLRSIILTDVEVNNASVENALSYLTDRSRQADPDKVGVAIEFRNFNLNQLPPRVTLRFQQATLMQALDEVCRQTRCNYLVGKDKITVMPQSNFRAPRTPLFH